MDSNTYLKERVEKQIDWYEKKSGQNKKRYLITKNLSILLSAGILLSAIFIQTDPDSDTYYVNLYVQIAIGLLGFCLLAITGWSISSNHQDLWNHYRDVAEMLKHEKNLFENKSGDYSNIENPYELLVERIESLISPRHSSGM